MLKIWFKPTCSTCRTALSLLKNETDEEIQTYEYLVEKPSQKEIREILSMLKIPAESLVRKKEPLYKEKFQGKKISNNEWIKILSQHPVLIERPIVIHGNKALIGRPAVKVLEIL